VQLSAHKPPYELPHLTTDLAQQRTSEKRPGTARSVAAEHSGELGATPASDSRRTAASHLGRAHAGAYRSDGECTGALGGELEALVRSAASGGAFSGNGARRDCCCCAARAEGEARAIEWMEGFWGRGSASQPGGWRRPATARPTTAYGRHVAVAGWSEAGVHARERGGGGGRPGCWLGRKGGGVGPVAPVPFSIFF